MRLLLLRALIGFTTLRLWSAYCTRWRLRRRRRAQEIEELERTYRL